MPRTASAARRALRLGFAPLLLVGFNGAAVALMARGAAAAWLAPLLALAVAASFAAERTLPYSPAWNRPQGDSPRDWAHAFVNEALNAAAIGAIPLVAASLPFRGVWPAEVPFVVQVLGAVFVLDFGITLAHWLSHRLPALWRLHAVHHSVQRMYGLNGLMKHPLHQAVETAAGATPLVLLGMPFDVAAVLGFCTAIQLMLQHSNVDYALGPLERWIAGNRIHRFHHVRDAVEGNVNFGLFTTLGDRLLGTLAWDPLRGFASGDLGLADRDDYPRAYLAQLLEPFRATVGSASATGIDEGVMPSRRRKVRAR